MTDKRKQLKVGIFVAVAAALVALVLIVFGGMRFWKHHDYYYVEFEDSVMGLGQGAPVYMNGIPIGSVDDVVLAPTNLSHVRVKISVDRGSPVRVDTRAFLSLAGITGLRVIDLKGGSLTAAAIPPDGVIIAGEGTLDKLQKKAEQLADETGKIMDHANVIIDSVSHVVENLADASNDIKALVADNRGAVKESLDSVAAAARSVSTVMNTQVGTLIGNANELVGDMRGVIHSNENVLRSTMSDLRESARSFKDLAREVRERPSRLVFSTAQPERKL